MSNYTFDENIVSDLHKDAYGCRPGELFWAQWNSATNTEKQAIWDQLLKRFEAEMDRYYSAEELAKAEYEILIQSNIKLGAKDRKTAIAWIVQSLELGDYTEPEYVCYQLGLPSSYSAEFAPFV